MVCDIDICDLCTAKTPRMSMHMWPKKEVMRLIAYLESMEDISSIAKEYMVRYNHHRRYTPIRPTVNSTSSGSGGLPSTAPSSSLFLCSMSHICNELRELKEVKPMVEREVSLKVANGKDLKLSRSIGEM